MSDGVSGDAVPVPETPPSAPNPAEAYKKKICPYLTLTRRQTVEGELEAQECVGPLCMFFLPIVEAGTGKVTDGHCAIALIPTSVNVLTNTLVAITTKPAPMVHSGGGNAIRKR